VLSCKLSELGDSSRREDTKEGGVTEELQQREGGGMDKMACWESRGSRRILGKANQEQRGGDGQEKRRLLRAKDQRST